MPRPRIEKPGGGGLYFAAPAHNLRFISSGAKVLDCVLGGGYPLGRIVNVIGDKSTGKTLLAIEACANFARQYDGLIYYREVEAAFDKAYAAALGLPLDRVDFGAKEIVTVEDVFEDLSEILARQSRKRAALYILDSLDALSDRSELDRAMDEGTYGAEKAKKMGQLFRRLVQRLGATSTCVFIVSQVRDAIGVSFGRKTTRSGGRALDFYASQVLYLAQLHRLKRTIAKVERPTGVTIKALCDKNKVGLPFRECTFDIRFGYGIDDVAANLNWLDSVGRLGELGMTKEEVTRVIRGVEKMGSEEAKKLRDGIAGKVEKVWYEIEREFLPKRRKYE